MSGLSTNKIIAVIGAGTMGAGIAQVAAQAGHPVLLYDVQAGAPEKAIEGISNGLNKLVERGKFTAGDVEATVSRLKPVSMTEDLAPAALVIEAIVENLTVKQELFLELENLCAEDTLLATNTSSLSVTAIANGLVRPGNFVGMHFFNPAQVMKLVEVISGSTTSRQTAETVFETANAWGKKPVHAASTPGFIVNRVARPFYAEALRVFEEGSAGLATIDAVMRQSGGFRMGPFELMDLIGHDVNLAVTKSVFQSYHFDPRFSPSLVQEDLVASGKLGRKSGCGFYDYTDDAPKAEPQTCNPAKPPEDVTILGDLGIAEPLADLMETFGVQAERKESEDGTGSIQVGSARLRLSDGAFATGQGGNDIFFDLALDYEKAERIALAPADGCDAAALDAATGLFQVLGKAVSIIDDTPGMIVMRTVCMLANEGADAVNQGVCDAGGVDTAMCFGVNYPLGPLQWADGLGLGVVEKTLDNMARIYGNPRYRCSPLIRRKALGGETFHQ